jgi:Predicted nucleic-acid-binding protein containing a Zn-ribbon
MSSQNEVLEKKKKQYPIIIDQKRNVALWESTRELKLKYLVSVEKIKKFFEGLLENKLLATKCEKCNEIYFPPQSFCSNCRSTELKWIELSKEGELLTFTKIFVKPSSFSHYEDYTIGIVRLREGVNVLAWISEKNLSKLKIGMKTRIETRIREPEGYPIYEIIPEELVS